MRIDLNKYRLNLGKVLDKVTNVSIPKGYEVVNARTNKKKNEKF
jgi:hypothetical protein